MVILLGLALLTLSWDKKQDSHSPMNGYPSFYPRIALVAPSPGVEGDNYTVYHNCKWSSAVEKRITHRYCCQPDEPSVSLATTNRIFNLYDFADVVFLFTCVVHYFVSEIRFLLPLLFPHQWKPYLNSDPGSDFSNKTIRHIEYWNNFIMDSNKNLHVCIVTFWRITSCHK